MSNKKYKEFIEYQISIGQTPLFGWDNNIREFELVRGFYIPKESVNNGRPGCEDMIRLECKYVDEGYIRFKTIEYYYKTYKEFIENKREEKLKELGI